MSKMPTTGYNLVELATGFRDLRGKLAVYTCRVTGRETTYIVNNVVSSIFSVVAYSTSNGIKSSTVAETRYYPLRLAGVTFSKPGAFIDIMCVRGNRVDYLSDGQGLRTMTRYAMVKRLTQGRYTPVK